LHTLRCTIAAKPKPPVPIKMPPFVPVSADCTDADSGGAASLRIAVVAEPFTGVRPTAPVGLANPVGSAEAGTPLSLMTVVELNCGMSPGVIGPMTVTVLCAIAAEARKAREHSPRHNFLEQGKKNRCAKAAVDKAAIVKTAIRQERAVPGFFIHKT
jgi:hypothetical protein